MKQLWCTSHYHFGVVHVPETQISFYLPPYRLCKCLEVKPSMRLASGVCMKEVPDGKERCKADIISLATQYCGLE